MLVIVAKLLPANRADHVARARLGLFDHSGSLLRRCELLGLLGKIFEVLFVQKSLILFCELSFFLQLENTRAQWSSCVDVRDVVFAHVDSRT